MSNWASKSDEQIGWELEEAETAAYQRGVADERARLLARVREVPSPWICRSTGAFYCEADDTTVATFHYGCMWCEARAAGTGNAPEHPENGCLWAEATATAPSAPPETSP